MDTPRTVVALVPARAGSKRVPGKNVRELFGHPLLAYTIAAAIRSGVFSAVIASTESAGIADIARRYGADVPFLRPPEMAGDLSPDIEWVRFTVARLRDEGRPCTEFALLRPTSPLRQPDTIRRAWAELSGDPGADSLRAVEPCRQHPGKMWVLDGADGAGDDPAKPGRMRPFADDGGADPPWHSRPYQSLPRVYVQNASLEIGRSRVVEDTGTIAGHVVRPFLCQGYEGFDLNDQEDWWVLEHLVEAGLATLPDVTPALARRSEPT